MGSKDSGFMDWWSILCKFWVLLMVVVGMSYNGYHSDWVSAVLFGGIASCSAFIWNHDTEDQDGEKQ